jgi:hypothetical protein
MREIAVVQIPGAIFDDAHRGVRRCAGREENDDQETSHAVEDA